MQRIESPIFVVGSVRSGSTLLGDMLGHHPDIAFPGEFEWAVEFGSADETPDLAAYHDWLAMNRHFLWLRLEIDPSLDYSDLVASLLVQMKAGCKDAKKSQLGVTVHRGFERLVELWPRGRFVHLVRDGRDVATSIVEQGWAGNHFTGARQWRDTEEEWERTSARIPPDRRIDVRFEDLVTDPRDTLARICAFVALPYSEEMMSYPRDSTYGEVDRALAQRWRRTQRPFAVRLAEAGAGDMLERRGYESSGLSRWTIGPALARLLGLHCGGARLRRRIQRYGLGLWLQRRAAAALGLEGWRRRIVLREHEITNRLLK
jgi:hypothetical protein